MKKLLILLVLIAGFASSSSADEKPRTTRVERRAIMAGNKLYKQSKYSEAAAKYREALKNNPSSMAASYNLGLSQLRLGAAPGVKDEDRKKYEQEGMKILEGVTKNASRNPDIASRAAYNMGNVAFNAQDYQNALNYYKESLRLNPENNDARRNLRITQKKLKNNNDQNKDKNKQNQDKDKKDQNKEKQDQNKDKQDNKDKDQKQDKQPQQPDNQISEQTADQILKAMENKEAQTRARVMNPQNQKNNRRTMSRKNW